MRWLAAAICFAVALAGATWWSMVDPAEALSRYHATPQIRPVLARDGAPLSRHYQGRWNLDQQLRLAEMPPALVRAFVAAEDQRFYAHGGVDWRARAHAVLQNLRAGRVVRGASTITEQVVRILNPRPRTVWSRWLEGWEAMRLERTVSKTQILEFYLNQVPYASNRRGIAQAARFYFDRDVATLDALEMQALAVLVRAPTRFDPRRGNRAALMQRVARLREQLGDPAEGADGLELATPASPVDAQHFVRALRARTDVQGPVVSTLDAGLQRRLASLVAERLAALAPYDVANAALLAVDHRAGDVLAWVVQGEPSQHIDAVLARRQPGSTLKPFVYALALEQGWHAETLIDDAPTSTAIDRGRHQFANYSRTHHGAVSLRRALGSSLNIPAVRTAEFVGVPDLLTRLRTLGLHSLQGSAEHYGVGLALGNGEVSLFELVGAYAALAAKGSYTPLRFARQQPRAQPQQVFASESASLISSILADPDSRVLEFGAANVLALPRQTAVKTGTSTDHTDAWTVAYDARFVVGVWLGNLDRRPTRGLSGARGPALIARGALAHLNRGYSALPLWRSPKLVASGSTLNLPDAGAASLVTKGGRAPAPRLVNPTPNLLVAMDPRVPSAQQAMAFEVADVRPHTTVRWLVNDELLAAEGARAVWPLSRGEHRVQATLARRDGTELRLAPVAFEVR